MGDININLLSNTDSSINFLNIMSSFCFRQWIHTPTRLNTDGNLTSLIDNIFSNTFMQLHSLAPSIIALIIIAIIIIALTNAGTIYYHISHRLQIFCSTYEEIMCDDTNHTKYIGILTEEKNVNISKLSSQESWISVNDQNIHENTYNNNLEIFYS